MNILFLDDNPTRTKHFRSCVPSARTTETAQECIEAFAREEDWDIVFLDHDLGGEVFVESEREETGMGVVRWMADNQPKVKRVVVHSMNPIAAREMVAKLSDAGYEAEWQMFGSFDPGSFVE